MKAFRFTVKGIGSFPLDMLRYDGCYPVNLESVLNIQTSFDPRARRARGEPLEIELVSHKGPPTKGRWDSFMWRVVKEWPT